MFDDHTRMLSANFQLVLGAGTSDLLCFFPRRNLPSANLTGWRGVHHRVSTHHVFDNESSTRELNVSYRKTRCFSPNGCGLSEMRLTNACDFKAREA